MSNSKLVNFTRISPNRTVNRRYKGRNHSIDTITIHCVVGQCSVETLGSIFSDSNREASSNYGVGYDGRIGMYVEEKDASWCSSSESNDSRAITIEVASNTYDPYWVNDKAYNATIELVADICRRNGIKKLVWSTSKSDRVNHKNGCNMTVHRDFANKSCPGDYLYNRMGDIANKVNKKLGNSSSSSNSSTTQATKPSTSNGNSAIKNVQSWVNKNYTTISVDGIYGPETKKGLVKTLQKELNKQFNSGLVVDGIWGPKTRSAVSAHTNLHYGSSGNITKTLQGLLICNGYSTGGLDGIFGNSTRNSVKKYQKNKGLVVDGIAGANTFEKLCS